MSDFENLGEAFGTLSQEGRESLVEGLFGEEQGRDVFQALPQEVRGALADVLAEAVMIKEELLDDADVVDSHMAMSTVACQIDFLRDYLLHIAGKAANEGVPEHRGRQKVPSRYKTATDGSGDSEKIEKLTALVGMLPEYIRENLRELVLEAGRVRTELTVEGVAAEVAHHVNMLRVNFEDLALRGMAPLEGWGRGSQARASALYVVTGK